jgi:hypothetical protein
MILRCTQKLLKASRIKPGDPGVQPDGLLGEWYANIVPLPFPGRVAVMFTSATTLLTVVAPGRVLRTTLPVFHQRLPALLRRIGLPAEWIADQVGNLGEAHVTKTLDRHVLGCMTDLAHQIQNDAYFGYPFERLGLDVMEDRLASVLLIATRFESAANRLRRIVLGQQ